MIISNRKFLQVNYFYAGSPFSATSIKAYANRSISSSVVITLGETRIPSNSGCSIPTVRIRWSSDHAHQSLIPHASRVGHEIPLLLLLLPAYTTAESIIMPTRREKNICRRPDPQDPNDDTTRQIFVSQPKSALNDCGPDTARPAFPQRDGVILRCSQHEELPEEVRKGSVRR